MQLPLLFALASAMTWGAGDFFGGLATRSAKAVWTTLVSQFVGLVALAAVCVLGAGGPITLNNLGWGVGAGLCSVVGLGLFYEAMGRGAFGPVASLTSVFSATVPIVFGLLLGERPPALVLAGAFVAVVAIWLIAGERANPDQAHTLRAASPFALGAGLAFGGYFVLLSRAGGESGLWPLVAGRTAASVALVAVIAVLARGRLSIAFVPTRQAIALAAVAGILDATANALYFLASRDGLLSVVAVIASMYPASTIVLARIGLRERVDHRRLVGMALGLVAVSVIARGATPESPVGPASQEVAGPSVTTVSVTTVSGTAVSGTAVSGTVVSGTVVSGTAVSGTAVSGTAVTEPDDLAFTESETFAITPFEVHGEVLESLETVTANEELAPLDPLDRTEEERAEPSDGFELEPFSVR